MKAKFVVLLSLQVLMVAGLTGCFPTPKWYCRNHEYDYLCGKYQSDACHCSCQHPCARPCDSRNYKDENPERRSYWR